MKRCITCKTLKPLDDYYRHPMMADGHLGRCKECQKALSKASRLAKIDQYRAYDRGRAKAPQRKLAKARYRQTYRAKYPERYRANQALGYAIRHGRIATQPCERCGREDGVHGHHDDYSRPLDVRWLCPACHALEHPH